MGIMRLLDAAPAPAPTDKPPLDHETLRDVIDLSLWAGQMMLNAGADSRRVEETVHRLGTAMGAHWLDIVILPEALIVTTVSGVEFRTKVRRIVTIGVNMNRICLINDLSRRVVLGQVSDRAAIRAELIHIDNVRSGYNRWFVAVMVGVACAAFCRLFGGGFEALAVTFVASFAATIAYQTLIRAQFNPLLVVTVTAFVAGLIAGILPLGVPGDRSAALAASVLLLVPGVPLVNSVKDILSGQLTMGVMRGLIGLLLSICIALGLLLALRVLGISGF